MNFGRCFEALLAEAAEPVEPPPAFGEELPAPALFAGRDGSGLRSEVNSELNFSPNFEGLVLGCIDADFCK